MPKQIREIPAYRITESAHYLRIPVATIRSWLFGSMYQTGGGRRRSQPIVRPVDRRTPLLSFLNLAEIHVLDSIRREHEIPLQKIRKALRYLKEHFDSERPLIEHVFQTDGLDLFVSKYGQLLNITRQGQIEMKEVIKAYLKRIEYDDEGLAARLFPFTRKRRLDEPMVVVIDPLISFGRPVIKNTGISTAVVAERYKAGDSIADLAEDYDLQSSEIEDAIRCELWIKAA